MILILVHSKRGTEQEVNLDLDEHLNTLVTLCIVDNILRKKAYQNAGHFVRSSDIKIQFHINSQPYYNQDCMGQCRQIVILIYHQKSFTSCHSSHWKKSEE